MGERRRRSRRRIVGRVFLIVLAGLVLFIVVDFDWSGRGGPAPTRLLSYDGVTWPVVTNEFLRSKGLQAADVPDEDNAALDYLSAAQWIPEVAASWGPDADRLLRNEQEYALRYIWPDQPALLWSYVHGCAPALDRVFRGLEKDRCAWYWVGSRDRLLSRCVALSPPARSLAEAVVLTGHSFWVEADGSQAAGHYLAAAELGDDIASGGDVVHVLGGCAATRVALDALDRFVLDRPSPEVLNACLRRIRVLEASKPDFALVVRHHRAMGLDLISAYGKLRISTFRGAVTGGGPVFGRSRLVRRTARHKVSDLYDRMEAWAGLPGRAKYTSPRDMQDIWEAAQKDWHLALVVHCMPCLTLAHQRYSTRDLRYAATQVRIGLALYMAQYGRYPDTLDEIEPYLDEIPLDPFTEEPFRYRREGDEYVFYSLGPDLTDNGGVDTRADTTWLYSPGTNGKSWQGQRDLVFTSKLTPPPPFDEFAQHYRSRPREGWSTEHAEAGE